MLVDGTSEDRMDDYRKIKRNLEILQQFCDKNFTFVQQNNNLEGGKKEKKEKNSKKEKMVKKEKKEKKEKNGKK